MVMYTCLFSKIKEQSIYPCMSQLPNDVYDLYGKGIKRNLNNGDIHVHSSGHS